MFSFSRQLDRLEKPYSLPLVINTSKARAIRHLAFCAARLVATGHTVNIVVGAGVVVLGALEKEKTVSAAFPRSVDFRVQ